MIGRWFLYVPQINPNTFVLYYAEGQTGLSWSIRDYSSQPTHLTYQRDYGLTATEVGVLASHPGAFAIRAPRERTDNYSFWNSAISRLNQQYLTSASEVVPASDDPRPAEAIEPTFPTAGAVRDASKLQVCCSRGRRIASLNEWFEFAPPAGGERHWKAGRSAMELARRWVSGQIPDEIAALLASHEAFSAFQAGRASAEVKVPLDGLAGNTRNSDLVVSGRCAEILVRLEIEGKADEPFGPTIGKRVRDASLELSKNPNSGALIRVRALCRAVFQADPEPVSALRYQLLHGVAAALSGARLDGSHRVAFVVHEFHTRHTDPSKIAVNVWDLEAFVRRLGGEDSVKCLREGKLAGPFRVPGNDYISPEVDLFIGKASARLL